jgi:hypothetical protein
VNYILYYPENQHKRKCQQPSEALNKRQMSLAWRFFGVLFVLKCASPVILHISLVSAKVPNRRQVDGAMERKNSMSA